MEATAVVLKSVLKRSSARESEAALSNVPLVLRALLEVEGTVVYVVSALRAPLHRVSVQIVNYPIGE
jgi:hypothetical protein